MFKYSKFSVPILYIVRFNLIILLKTYHIIQLRLGGSDYMINSDEELSLEYLLSPEFEMINSAGKPLTDGWLEVYIHGTRDKYYCCSDFDGTLHPFKIPLDSIGSNIVLADPSKVYDVYVYNKFGSLIMSRYNVKCQGGGGTTTTEYIGDRLEYGQYSASDVTTLARLARLKGNIETTLDGFLRLKKDMSYHVTVRGTFVVDDPANVSTSLNYIEYSSFTPIKVDIDETVTGEQHFELSYDVFRLQEDMDYQVAFDASNGTVTNLAVEVHSLSNLNTTITGGQPFEQGWGILIEDNVISVDPTIFNDYVTWNDLTSAVSSVHNEITNETIELVSSVSSVLQSEIDNIQQGVQADWEQDDDTQPDYIKNKPDLSVYATHDEVIETVSSVSSVLQEEIDNIPEQVQSDWEESDTESPAYIQNKPDLDIYATHEEVNTATGDLVNIVSSVSSVLQTNIEEGDTNVLSVVSAVSSVLQNEIDDIPEQVQADWDQTDDTQKDYIKNKPDLDIYATVETVSGVSSVLVELIDDVSAAVPEAQVQSDWTETDVDSPAYIQNKPDLSQYVTDIELVEAISGVTGHGDYGQFYCPEASGACEMAKTKGTIDVTNDGKIKLEKGQSYHVTVRGRYVQSLPDNVATTIGYIEYITNSTINVNVDRTTTDSQYFEISYDLYKLANDVNYYVFFTGVSNAGLVKDLFIEIHAIGGAGVSSPVSGGGGAEYDAGWGIQILNNVISVNSDIIPEQVQSDWTEQDIGEPSYIKNKPEVMDIYAGQNITLTETASGLEISSYGATDTSAVSAIAEAYMEAVTAMIPEAQVQSDWTETDTAEPSYILHKPDEISLYAGTNVSITVSGASAIISASGGGGGGTQVQSDWTETDTSDPSYIQNKPTPRQLVAGNNVEITIDGASAIISAQGGGGGGATYSAGQNISIDNQNVIAVTGLAQADWNSSSGASQILNKPTEKNLVAGANVTITESNDDVIVQTTEIASGLQLAAGTGITLTVSGNYLVIGLA